MSSDNSQDSESEKVIPAELRRVLDAEYYNGFGFQCSGLREPEVLVGWVSAPHIGGSAVPGVVEKTASGWGDGMKLNLQGLENLIRDAGVSTTFRLDDFLGRDYLTVHYDEWEAIPALINLCLENGVRVNIGNKGQTVFNPRGCRDHLGRILPFRSFNRRNLELAIIEQTEDFVRRMTQYDPPGSTEYERYNSHVRNASGGFGRNLWCCWNWSTQEGKAFCAKLRRILRKKRPVAKHKPRYLWDGYWDVCAKYKVYHCGEWSGFQPSMISVNDLIEIPLVMGKGDRVADRKRRIEEISKSQSSDSEVEVLGESEGSNESELGGSESEQVCMICLDAYPDTMVLPCEHQVVCRGCSDGLRGTNDRRTCVRCRRPITSVLADGDCRQLN